MLQTHGPRTKQKADAPHRWRATMVWAGYLLMVVLYAHPLNGGELFGAAAGNNTGSPIGGGEGYQHFVTTWDHYVATFIELTNALAKAVAGEVIYVADDAEIDVSGYKNRTGLQAFFEIPAGVTLAGGRGKNGGQAGGLIYSDEYGTWPLFTPAGPGVRVTGLRLRGPDPDIGTHAYDPPISTAFLSNYPIEVDNCEIYEWGCYAIGLRKGASNSHIHHNYIHHNRRTGLGYGVSLWSVGNTLIEANIFDHNRHDIAATGYPKDSYTARYNLILGDGTSFSFDMHGNRDRHSEKVVDPVTGQTNLTHLAGEWLHIHHNTFLNTTQRAVGIRGVPRDGAEVHNNVFIRDRLSSVMLYSTQIVNDWWNADENDDRFLPPEPYKVYVARNLFDEDTFAAGYSPHAVWVAREHRSNTVQVIQGVADADYSLLLRSRPSDDVTITMSYDSERLTVSPSTVTFTPANWYLPQKITVSAADQETGETYPYQRLIDHTVTSGGGDYEALSASNTIVEIFMPTMVFFDAQGGTAPDPAFQPVTYGEPYGTLANTAREGHTFAGWWTAPEGGGTQVTAATEVDTDDDHTLYAQWTVNQYTLTFDSNGGSPIDPITQDYGTAVTPPANPTRTGYTFSGWNPAVPGTMPAENRSLTAQWTVNQYTLTFDSNGGSPVDPITQDYGTNVTPPSDPTRTGYTFSGWNEVPATMPAENRTLTAQWTVNQYTLTFDSDDGSPVDPITQDYGTDVTPPADPTRTGYTFSGWNPAVPETMPDENRTLTAQWTINQYTLTFDSNDGSPVDPITQDYATDVTPPADPTRTGYTFSGWNPAVPETMPAENLTLTAGFEPNPLALSVASIYGSPDPAVGEHASYYEAVLTNTVDAAVAGGEGTQYVAVGWSMLGNDPASGVGNSMVMTITNDAVLTWNWNTQVWFDADVAGPFGDLNSVMAETGWHPLGTTATATAMASPGFRFLQWGGDAPEGMAHANPVEVTMDRARTLTAWFTNVVTLAIASAHGGCAPPPGVTTNDWGTLIPELTVTDAVQQHGGTQWVAVGWTGSGSVPAQGHGVDAGSVVLTNDSAIIWHWQTNYWLTVANAHSAKGDVLVYTNAALAGSADMAAWLRSGTDIRIEAAASNFYRFLMWDGDVPAHADPSDPVLVLTNDRSRAISAVFEQPDAVTLTVVSAHGGSVPPPGVTTNDWGTQIPILAVTETPQEHGGTQYVAVGWSGGGSVPASGVGSDAGPVRLTYDSFIAWHWETNYWLAITVDNTSKGDVLITLGTDDPRFGECAKWTPPGTPVQAEAVAAHGFQFQHWEGNLAAALTHAPALDLTIDQTLSLSAVFKPVPPGETAGTARYVSSAGNHAYPFTNWVSAAMDIQSAIDAAAEGDTIWVHDGIYDAGGKAVFGTMTNRVALDKAVMVRSVNGPAATLIVGQGPSGATAVRGAYVGAGAVLSGFTLTNGHTRVYGDYIHERSGGGAWCDSSGLVDDCVIVGNKAVLRGGGLYGGTATDSLVQNNTARDGGGAYGTTLEYSRLRDNVATQQGGGAWGGILRNVRISGNTAAFGGGVYQGTLYNCEVTENEANSGGGVYNAVVQSSTLTANRAVHTQGRGGGAFSATVANSIVYGNTAPHSANSSDSHFSFSCTTPLPSSGTGNLDADPGFVDALAGDFRLAPDSPCVNAGQNRAWMETATDLDGHPRIMFRRVDIGCYESVIATDSDGDGLPDWWESYYFGGATNAMPTAMAANQVHTLLETYIAGLDPHDPTAFWGIGTVQSGAAAESGQGRMTLRWPSQIERLYAVDWIPVLGAEPQRIAEDLAATPPYNIFTDPVSRLEPQGFYVIHVYLE